MAAAKLDKIKHYLSGRKSQIQSIVREPTAGGMIFRHASDGGVEFLLAQDQHNRWTIVKGHIEPGETPEQTAKREIAEESGLQDVEMLGWLGKVSFRYRRMSKLVLMTTQVYLVCATKNSDKLHLDEWMKDIRWFKANDALDAVEYEDVEKIMLLAMRRIRQENL